MANACPYPPEHTDEGGENCPDCEGWGDVRCRACGGLGYIDVEDGDVEDCDKCTGTGGDTCRACGGTGERFPEQR